MDLAVQRVFIEDHTPWQEPEEPAIQANAIQGAAHTITNAIRENPTPENLDALLAQHPTFRLEQRESDFRMTVLEVAIHKHALPLIRHILTIRPDLANATWSYLDLPQISSATKSWDMFSEFIKRGANIHAQSCRLKTVLSAATSFDIPNISPDMSVVKYLLRHGAVINELERQEILGPNSALQWSWFYKEYIRNQPAIVRRGLEQILGEDLFLQGHLPLPLTEKITIQLPPEIRTLIWRFMTNCWDAPAIKNCVIFPLISEKEARKMLLIEMLAAEKIERLCGELVTFSKKVDDAIYKARKMLLIEKLATKKIEQLCGELATFSKKVEACIAELSKPE